MFSRLSLNVCQALWSQSGMNEGCKGQRCGLSTSPRELAKMTQQHLAALPTPPHNKAALWMVVGCEHRLPASWLPWVKKRISVMIICRDGCSVSAAHTFLSFSSMTYRARRAIIAGNALRPARNSQQVPLSVTQTRSDGVSSTCQQNHFLT
jgi:hypothetical protein